MSYDGRGKPRGRGTVPPINETIQPINETVPGGLPENEIVPLGNEFGFGLDFLWRKSHDVGYTLGNETVPESLPENEILSPANEIMPPFHEVPPLVN
ncbi:hypothetical protein AVEN_114652-1 [Araneus ventricosus]|uniref:Uncharacterized protein n=1 Tax=Araneus ventricosus TaxID=182803 RepID=A0A4Y2NJH5_ARAVE|nr:hypothetical protein AVEN_114652-1 [Araneus ventricosus]